MAKTQLTKDIEEALIKEVSRMGLFICEEVTIGIGGKERVDLLSYDTKGIWRCYETKVSKSDFHSKAKKTFIGHYNYFLMPEELYEELKDEIAKDYKGIGVYAGYYSGKTMFVKLVKNPKKRELTIDEHSLKDSMIRSLYREAQKVHQSDKVSYMAGLKSRNTKLNKELKETERKLNNLNRAIYLELGREEFHKFQDKYDI